MLSYAVFWIFLGHFVQIKSETVSSVPIRILDAVEKSSNIRPVIYGENRNREPSYSDYYYENRYNDRDRGGGGGGGGGGRNPFGSYVIYDDGPGRKVFHRWNFNGNNWNRVPNWPTRKAEWISKPQDYFPHYKKDGYDFPKPKPTLSYQSVYSNTIKVYEEPPQDFYPDNKKYTGETKFDYLKYENAPAKPDYEVHYPYSDGKKYYNDPKIPDNFPKIFSPNRGFRFSISEKPRPGPPKNSHDGGYYRTHTVNYATQNESRSFNPPDRKRSSCNLIRLGSQSFPERNEPCARSENIPLTLLDYPDYSKFSNEEIPMEHRRQNYFKAADRRKGREKRSAFGYGYGFDSWKGNYSPYDRNFNDYSYYSYYPSYDSYDNNLDGNYYRNGYYNKNRYDRDRGFGYNRYGSGGSYYSGNFDDEYRNSEETTTKGLTAFLTNGGRRDKSRNNRGEEDDEDGEDSEEEFRSRRRDMFKNNSNGNNRNEDENRNRQGMNNNNNNNKRRQNGESGEDGEEERSGQGNYGRNSMRNNRNRYNSRNNDRYGNNNRYGNRGSYGHNGNYGSNGNYGNSGSYGSYGSNGNYGSYGNSNSNGYGRNNGDMDRENRPFGLYG